MSTFPSHIFPNYVVCTKIINYQLVDIVKFENDFVKFDLVFISCGINDLSRYDKMGQDLSKFICEKFIFYTSKFPETTFIFNSMLLTRHEWLNLELTCLNECVFELSVKLDNLWFLDSHHVFNDVDFKVLDRSHDIHISPTAKKYISSIIRRCILNFYPQSPTSGCEWPLSPRFLHKTPPRTG